MGACFLKGESSFVLRGSHFCFSWESLFLRWIHFRFMWEPFLFFFSVGAIFLRRSDSSRSRFLPHPLTVHNVVPACLGGTKTDQSDGGTKKETCSRTKNKGQRGKPNPEQRRIPAPGQRTKNKEGYLLKGEAELGSTCSAE